MNEFVFQPATKLLKAIQDRKISSLELLNLYIERFERFNPTINAIVTTDFDDARTRAAEADETLARGEKWGLLHGLPITIKDTFEVVGMPCTSGSPHFKNHMPKRNADVVQILLDEGAIVFGKTNLPVFAMDFQSFNEVYGQTNNPWDKTRTPGGSSGGAAAALASGLTGLEIGSDLGGSIRNPAHFCGIYGHKPTFDIVSLRGHILPPPDFYPGDYSLAGDISVAGPLARSAKDLDLVMGLIAAPKKPAHVAWRFKLPKPRKKSLKNYRIGLWLDDPAFPVDTSVLDCLQTVVDKLAKTGAVIEDKRPEIDFDRSHEIYLSLVAAVSSAGFDQKTFDGILTEVQALSKDDQSTKARLFRGYTQLQRNWMQTNYTRLLMQQKWADFFKNFDVLLTPVVGITAFKHDHSEFFGRTLTVNNVEKAYIDVLNPWAGLTGVVYLPSTVAPVGLARDGLPVGVQIVGPYLEDRTSIHIAELMMDIVGGFIPPPGYN